MGPVNLRAEAESQELNEQIEGLNLERDDLLKAIDKLRRGINDLNREGRQRLLDSFKEVDKHFQDLFVRLFGGGRAHLELTDAEDPLEAGIEIYASPPGKKLQILSLLSGGEQALTATALLFAVFLTNPAPICVLDAKEAFDGLTGPKSLWILNCACCISIDLRIRRVSARQMQSAAATLP